MDYKLIILLAGAILSSAAPAEKAKEQKAETDLKAEEGRQHYTVAKSLDYHSDYSAPGPLYSQSYAPAHGSVYNRGSGYGSKPYAPGGGVSNVYHRRGHASESYGHPGDYAKSSVYGHGYRAPAESSLYRASAPGGYGHRVSSIRNTAYARPDPSYASPPSSYGHPSIAYSRPAAPYSGGYADYGPPNAYSAQSQLHSQDPSYDPAKDPVSQYASYIPVREYGPDTNKDKNELSIYGY